jgi:hypothetical protein
VTTSMPRSQGTLQGVIYVHMYCSRYVWDYECIPKTLRIFKLQNRFCFGLVTLFSLHIFCYNVQDDQIGESLPFGQLFTLGTLQNYKTHNVATDVNKY